MTFSLVPGDLAGDNCHKAKPPCNGEICECEAMTGVCNDIDAETAKGSEVGDEAATGEVKLGVV